MSTPVYIFGHKNPDTDSICSAIAYTYLKSQIDPKEVYLASRLGDINQETSFVLNYFQMAAPTLLEDVRTQVCDIEIKSVPLSPTGISLQEAWERLKRYETHTLPLSDDGKKLCGLITVGGIAEAYMALHDPNILHMSDTPIENLVHVLKAEILYLAEANKTVKGRVLVGAMHPDYIGEHVQEGDLIILGNREKSQMAAIVNDAKMMILTGGARPTDEVLSKAMEKGCSIVMSPLDTFAVARSIYNALPVKYFMKSLPITYFELDDYLEDVHITMTQKRYRNFPVVDDQQNYVGMISRIQLLRPHKKRVILMDHNEQSQTVDGIKDAEVLEIIDHHRIGGFQTPAPVYFRNQPVGCTATIVGLLFKENGISVPPNIAGLLCSAILSDTLIFKSPTCTTVDRDMAIELAFTAGIQWEIYGRTMFKAGSDLLRMTPEEIFYQDFKVFTMNGLKVGVGQVSSMEEEILNVIEIELQDEVKGVQQKLDFDLVLFMLTNIGTESTLLLYSGSQSYILEKAFPKSKQEDKLILKGIVSRKKQLIPALIQGFEEVG